MNKELIEIKDSKTMEQLKKLYNSDEANKNILTPIICGSVVDGGKN